MTETMDQSASGAAENEEQFFTLWTVFKRSGAPATPVSDGAVEAFETLAKDLGADNVTLRGLYDVSAMRVDADVMVWLHGSKAEALQAALRRIRRTELFANTEIAWSAMGVHRDAEFSKNHWPSFARGIEPEAWICVYPFVRSYEWYLLPAEERGKMLRDHGMLGREFPQVLANTVASFALGDWEWILGLEAPNLVDLVDMMRHLRSTEARNHVREEVPFYTGRRIPAAEVAEVLK
ncbi:chlorite dismutase family protein [Arthrobacter zhangbolii]|uniref:Coproheme decarboxylase n=1 Tax=Arthrobacter zhangbolii TaxID=2886936 RepID=A0A9X1SCJ2_9MICC|nr:MULTISPECIES: hydrogen peroxide-dependent heme synthase [Arthrobacter]MCC3273959.1 chlorite dismutase family protein [Arthrobacter zhangbolii]MCC3294879.1 chlorite dismutase family protein [Arthrobacter zhangbolii]MDN3903925.1 chlorite dismutase family protein [Arthrobacter sp. YD2]UON91309.1 chlorite dismutase family protein [Arthrobacter zhangbolii]